MTPRWLTCPPASSTDARRMPRLRGARWLGEPNTHRSRRAFAIALARRRLLRAHRIRMVEAAGEFA